MINGDKMKKIKVAMVTNHFGMTGIAAVMMNYCKCLDRNKYKVTIIAGKPFSEVHLNECKQNGIEIQELPSRYGDTFGHYFNLWKVLKKGKFDIVHIHGNSAMMAIELMIALAAGIHIRIAHCHNSTCINIKAHRMLQPLFNTLYQKGLACSDLAGKWAFGEKEYEVLPNAFETKKFAFNIKRREQVRAKYRIENRFVIGHIGRFNEQKNQQFLIDILKEVLKTKDDAVLMLVGDGPDFEKISDYAKSAKLKNNVLFCGETNDTASLYDAMDVFVFPSKYEGLGIVAVEAQISGLPCVISDKVPRDVVVGPNVSFLSLDNKISCWVDVISNGQVSNRSREVFYDSNKKQIAKFEIEENATRLDKIYESLLSQKG